MMARDENAGAWDAAAAQAAVGREARATDTLNRRTASLLLDTLGHATARPVCEGDEAPPGAHWCLAPPETPIADLREDGHPGGAYGMLPELPRSRRMWAGGEVRWHGSFRIGDFVLRQSRIEQASLKHGRSGALCFVTLAHEYSIAGRRVISERQDIVYRGENSVGAPPPEPTPVGTILQRLPINPVRLFRFSALTGNAHRIHYDLPYATAVEGYPALVIHGPLQAAFLMQIPAKSTDRPLRRFSYRASRPLFSGADLLGVRDPSGDPAIFLTYVEGVGVGMRAEAEWGF